MPVAQQTAAELVHTILDLQRAVRGATAASTRHSELGPAHVAVLFFIREGGPMRASALADELGIGPSALSRQLAELEQYGFVVRAPDPLDGRACLLSLTGEGRAYLSDAYEQRAEVLRAILAGWTESEAESALVSVQHLTRAFRSAATHPAGAGHPVRRHSRSTPRTTAHRTGNDGRSLAPTSETTKEER